MLQAIAVFGVLVYIHAVFASASINCLEDVQDAWPRDGILRVEILRNATDNYGINQSYEKEYSDRTMDGVFAQEMLNPGQIFDISDMNGTESIFGVTADQVISGG